MDPELLAELQGGLADERYRAHRAVRTLLELLADPNALVLVLDDLHWADSASIELIARAAPARAGGAGAARVRVPPRPGARAPRRRRWPCRALTRIELDQLSEDEAAELLDGLDAAARGRGLPPRRRQPVLPRAARARSRARASCPRRRPATAATCRPPWPLRWRWSSRRSRRPVAALLDAAAVAGEPFEPDLASAVAELAQAEGLAALDDLLAADLVRPTQVPRRFIFRHPLVRHAVLRVDARRLAARRARARGRGAGGARRRPGRARAPRRAVGRPGRRGRDPDPAPGRRRRGRAGAGGGRALVRGGPAAAAGGGPRPAGRRARGAGVGAALDRRARALPRDAARRLRPRTRSLERRARRADRPVRRRRALARPPRRGPRRLAAPGSASPSATPSRPRHSRSSWRSTACTRSTSSRRARWEVPRSRRRASSATGR